METVGSIQVVASINTKDYDAGKKHIESGNKDLEQDSERASLGVSSKWGSALKGVGVAAAAGFAAATTAVAAFGVSSIKSYAEYEQLVGGVDTLFKQSSNTIQQYAQNAYKTAGLSANAYMSTITSFSASLLQGLGGDTKKAAEIGNMAVTDMADNANKMGTSIESIQDAYQGFAKDNYTMLDNLKLGYGGTAGEMARLINDSGVLGDSMKLPQKQSTRYLLTSRLKLSTKYRPKWELLVLQQKKLQVLYLVRGVRLQQAGKMLSPFSTFGTTFIILLRSSRNFEQVRQSHP